MSSFCHFPIGDWSLCPDYAGMDAITKAALAHTDSDSRTTVCVCGCRVKPCKAERRKSSPSGQVL